MYYSAVFAVLLLTVVLGAKGLGFPESLERRTFIDSPDRQVYQPQYLSVKTADIIWPSPPKEQVYLFPQVNPVYQTQPKADQKDPMAFFQPPPIPPQPGRPIPGQTMIRQMLRGPGRR